MMHSVFEFKIS